MGSILAAGDLWFVWVMVGVGVLVICAQWWGDRVNYKNDVSAISTRVSLVNGRLVEVSEEERHYSRSARGRGTRTESRYLVTYLDSAGQRWRLNLQARCDWSGQTSEWNVIGAHRIDPEGPVPDVTDRPHPFDETDSSRTHSGERPTGVRVIFAPTHKPAPPEVDLGPDGPRKRHGAIDPDA